MERLTVGPTEVLIDDALPDPLLPVREGRVRVAILTQPAPTDVALRLAHQMEDDGLVTEVVGLPDREEAKTLEVASSIYEVLAKFGLTRGDTVVSVGGGAASDLGGFVAGTWMRGVESVLVPTTLLGSVDASIGGKTGVNVSGKNLVGVFWPPSRVAIDVSQLSRLPSSLVRDGMSEAYKAGLVGDPELVERVGDLGTGVPLDFVVRRSIEVKARIVAEDERELGVRAVLNFGHTFGHALEYASTLTHGEAIALGMVAAVRISAERLGFAHEPAVVGALEKLGLPTTISGVNRERVIDLLDRDKKRDQHGMRMVLLSDIGEPEMVHVGEREIAIGLMAIGL